MLGLGTDYSFAERLTEIGPDDRFAMPGWHVWCGSAVRGPDGLYYLFFSRWPEKAGFEAWVTCSEIALAVSERPAGPYRYLRTLLQGSKKDWDRVKHNPTVLAYEGRYYLYYMGTNARNGKNERRKDVIHTIAGIDEEIWWKYRNNQRIGVASADHPAGPWTTAHVPLLDVTPGSWDGLLTSNPSVCVGHDRQVVMMYKGVSEGPMPRGGAVNAGVAFASHPLGPFAKRSTPGIANPENPWAVEDPCLWFADGRYWALMKDFQGYYTKDEPGSIALFESADGESWQPCQQPLAMRKSLRLAGGSVQAVHRLERPQVLLENGRPSVCFLAVLETTTSRSYNVHLTLE